MKTMHFNVLASLCALGALGASLPATAQMTDIKEKPAMYTYEASWAMPRARWADMEKMASNRSALEKLVANGTLVGFGDDEAVVHSEDGMTHLNWWSAMSMAGVLNALEEIGKSGTPATAAVLAASTKHSDEIIVSHYYNWKPGTYKGAYEHTALYTLKADAPDDAMDVIAKTIVGPVMEKLLADGTIVEWEVDEEAIHSNAPGAFSVTYVTPTAEGTDKVIAAIRERGAKNPLISPAYGAMVEWKAHRDVLTRSTLTFK